ncbi:hypothetical protein [Macrococcus capreoli]|uniref:hypothetical protein n=1 Tax=Macrococcus capreoli TaxID=2982690 RepID=UPI003EE42973
MNINEFKNILENMSEDFGIPIKASRNGNNGAIDLYVAKFYFATISEVRMCRFKIEFSLHHGELAARQLERLLEAISRYAATPLEDRRVLKYHIKLIGNILENNCYLNLDVETDLINFNSKEETEIIKTSFTKDEIKHFGLQKYADCDLFELEEVEDSNG